MVKVVFHKKIYKSVQKRYQACLNILIHFTEKLDVQKLTISKCICSRSVSTTSIRTYNTILDSMIVLQILKEVYNNAMVVLYNARVPIEGL